jgi:hypothetical protein
MRAGTPQFFGDNRMVSADHIGGLPEKPPHYVPQAGTGNARYAVLAEASDERCPGLPARRRDG